MRDVPGVGRDAIGAAPMAGAAAIALFVAGAVVIGERPPFDAPGEDLVAFLDEHRARVQLGCALLAVAAPLLVWFLATVVSLAGPSVAARVGYGCGLAFVTLFCADVAALAAAALRPRTPEIATTLRDVEFLAMGVAAPLVTGMLAAFATLPLWPRWLRWLGAIAAAIYALRIGTLFTTDGAFAADGLLGLWLPVCALASWVVLASAVLARRRSHPRA